MEFEKNVRKSSEHDIALIAKRSVLDVRDEHRKRLSGAFHDIEGTCAKTPTTEHIRHLAPYTIYSPVNEKTFELVSFISGSGNVVYLADFNKCNTIETERILRMKMFYFENYAYELHRLSLNRAEDYHYLPEIRKERIIYEYLFSHRFAADYIFGSEHQFRCVAHKHAGDPLMIASEFKVPVDYVMYQLGHYGINECHYISSDNGKVYRHIGKNQSLLAQKPKGTLLAETLHEIVNKAKGREIKDLVYRNTKIENDHFVCIGRSILKNGLWRTHVYGVKRDFVASDMLKNLSSVGIPVNYF